MGEEIKINLNTLTEPSIVIGPSAGSDAIAASTHAGVLRVRSPLCTEMGWEEWGKTSENVMCLSTIYALASKHYPC